MSLIDSIVDIFLSGPDDWEARLLPSIEMISPEGSEHTAKWIGDSRSRDKKLGIFSFPGVAGSVVQDLSVDSYRYSIPFYFDGKDNDINAKAFAAATGEDGPWTITHPVYGFLELQLTSTREESAPTTSGGITVVQGEWIEPIDPTTLMTAAEAAGYLDGAIDDLNISAMQQFQDNLNTATEALTNGIDTIVNGVTNLTDAALAPLTSSVDFLQNTSNLIQNGILDTLNASVLDVLSLAGQIQQLIQLPALATTSIAASQSYYSDLATGLFAALPAAGKVSAKSKNDVVVLELALSAVIAGAAKTTTVGSAVEATAILPGGTETAPIETREQAVAAAISTAVFFENVTNNLETVQKSFEDNDIDEQYFAQPLSFPDAAIATAGAVRYLLISAYDLKVARNFVLAKPRSPIEITVAEYGDLGPNDANLDLFIQSNSLRGDDIYILPAGREVVVYA